MDLDKQNSKILCDIIDPEPSGDDREDTQYDIGLIRSDQYDVADLISSFGTDNFMSIFNNSIDTIKTMNLSLQKSLCEELIKKIESKYEYIFPFEISLIMQKDYNLVYDLVEFLQFNYLEFITSIWKALNVKNIIKLDLDEYFTNDIDIINIVIEQITNNLIMYNKNTLIYRFLFSCSKETIIDLIKEMSKNKKHEITIKLMGAEW